MASTDAELARPGHSPGQWLLNVGTGYVDAATGAVVYLLLTPLLVRHLGLEVYGIWVLSHAIASYLNLFDLGLGEAQVRFHSRYAARGRDDLVRRLIGSIAAAMLVAGALAALTGAVVTMLPYERVFEVSSALAGDLRVVMLVLAAQVLVAIPASVLDDVYEATERFDVRNARSIALRLAAAGAIVLLVRQECGIVALALVGLITTCVELLLDVLILRRLQPGLMRVRVGFQPRIWARIRHFTVWASIDDLLAEASSYVDEILLAVFLPIALLTPYALAGSLSGAILLAIHPIVVTLFPRAVALHARRNLAVLRKLLLLGCKGLTAIIAPAVLFLSMFGQVTLEWWVPEGAAATSLPLIALLALDAAVSVFLWPASIVLAACGRVRLVVLLTVLEIVLEVTLMAVLTPQFGLVGVACACLIANTAVGLLIELPAAARLIGMPLVTLWWSTVPRLALALVPAAGVAWCLQRWLAPADLAELSITACAIAVIYFLGFWLVGSSPAERREVSALWRQARGD
jgi:O-antigen/teichoic acid export membrane protein